MEILPLILVACLLTGAPQGVCNAEIACGASLDDFPERVEVPQWASDRWQDFAAHIVASEARNVPSADIVVACTLIRDVESATNPVRAAWGLRRRWFGYGRPDDADRQAVLDALFTNACDTVPSYRYVGNIRDVYHWRAVGMVGAGPFDLYVGPTGSTVVGVQ